MTTGNRAADRAAAEVACPPPKEPGAAAEPGPDPHLVYRRLDASSADPAGTLILVDDAGVLVRDGDPPRLPTLGELAPSVGAGLHQIAVHGGRPVYAARAPGADESAEPAQRTSAGPAEAAERSAAAGEPSPIPTDSAAAGLTEIGYRELYGRVPDAELGLVARAIQIVAWDDTSRFCSRCGTPTVASATDCSKSCPACGLGQYPRLAPAMIVGVVRDGKLLLAQSPRFRGRFYSILAGFLEPGETAEACVEREVYEEVGIRVRNIRYFGSQPWPFPHSLMLGFTAEHEAGEITPDLTEIVEAGWFGPDELPQVPTEVSISGRIIRWFRETYGW